MPGCETFRDPHDTWTGMDHDQGQAHVFGCDYHCIPCALITDVELGVGDSGGRFLIPTRDRPSRNGVGDLAPLLSNVAQYVPVIMHWDRAPCWKNPSSAHQSGKECVRSFCNCDWQLDQDWAQEHPDAEGCRDVGEGQLRTIQLPDNFFFTGHEISPDAGQSMDCRTERPPQIGMILVSSDSGRGDIYQLHSLRDQWCTLGFNLMLFGETMPGSTCHEGERRYFNNTTRSRWARWFVPDFNARMGRPEHHSAGFPSTDASLDAQNAALLYVEIDADLGFYGKMHFDQVEKEGFGVPGAVNNSLPRWWRTFKANDRADPPEHPPPGGPIWPPVFLPNGDHPGFAARTKWGHQPIRCEMTIVEAELRLNAVLAYIKHRTTPIASAELPGGRSFEHQIWPSMRVMLEVEFATRAYPIDGVEYIAKLPNGNEVSMEIVNPEFDLDQDFPRMDPPLDTIEYNLPDAKGNDRWFTPPKGVRWFAKKGPLSSGAGVWENRMPTDDETQNLFRGSHTIENACRKVSEQFLEDNPVVVPGAPTEHDQAEQKQRYLGRLSFHITDFEP